jgi:hypothetical protein
MNWWNIFGGGSKSDVGDAADEPAVLDSLPPANLLKKRAVIVSWDESQDFGVLRLDDGAEFPFFTRHCSTTMIGPGECALAELEAGPEIGLQLRRLRFKWDFRKDYFLRSYGIEQLRRAGLLTEWSDAEIAEQLKFIEGIELGWLVGSTEPESARTVNEDRAEQAIVASLDPEELVHKRLWAYLIIAYYGIDVCERGRLDGVVILHNKLEPPVVPKSRKLEFWHEMIAVANGMLGMPGYIAARLRGSSVVMTCSSPPAEARISIGNSGALSVLCFSAYNQILKQIGCPTRVYTQPYYGYEGIREGTMMLLFRNQPLPVNDFMKTILSEASFEYACW